MRRLALAGICVWWMMLAALAAMCSGCTYTRVPGYFTRVSVGQAIGFTITITDPESQQTIKLEYGTDGGAEAFKKTAEGIITSKASRQTGI